MQTRSLPFKILYEDSFLVAIDKPWGFHVHSPENQTVRVPREKICLPLLRSQVGCYVYPIHRIDVATTGVLLWAKSKEIARELNLQFQNHIVKKEYFAIVRGYTPDQATIDVPLCGWGQSELQVAKTVISTVARVELPFPVGKKFPYARYSYIKALPETGRFHQIRRHCNRISHPIIGDTDHGDSHHNRFFRDHFKLRGLCLRASRIDFIHPDSLQPLTITAEDSLFWTKAKSIFETIPKIKQP